MNNIIVKKMSEISESVLKQLYALRFIPNDQTFEEYIKSFTFVVVDDVVYAEDSEKWRVDEYLRRSKPLRACLPDAIIIEGTVMKNRYGHVNFY